MAHLAISSYPNPLYGYEVSYETPEETESGKFLIWYGGSSSTAHTDSNFIALVEAKLALSFGSARAKQVPWSAKAINLTPASYVEYVFP